MKKRKISFITDNSRNIVFKRRFAPIIYKASAEFEFCFLNNEMPEPGDIIIFLIIPSKDWMYKIIDQKKDCFLIYDNTNSVKSYLEPPFFRKIYWGLKGVFLRRKHPLLSFKHYLKKFDLIVAGSNEQQKYLLSQGFKNVKHLVDPISEKEYSKKWIKRDNSKIRILWEGTEPSFAQLWTIVDMLILLQKELSFQFMVFCDRPKSKTTIRLKRRLQETLNDFHFIEWQQNKFVEIHQCATLAIAPIDTSQHFNRSKPYNKLITYASFGLPVVCSDIPSYKEFENLHSFVKTASTNSEWIKNIKFFLDDKVRYEELSKEAFNSSWSSYNDSLFVHKYLEIINDSNQSRLIKEQKFQSSTFEA